MLMMGDANNKLHLHICARFIDWETPLPEFTFRQINERRTIYLNSCGVKQPVGSEWNL